MDDELLRFARLAMAVARPCMPLRLTRFAHLAYPPAGLFAALLLREHPRPPYRGLEDLLRLSGRLRRLFGLRVVPDHSTLWWSARRRLSDDLIAAAPGETVRGGGDRGRQVAPGEV